MYSKYIFKSIFFPKCFFKNVSFCSNIDYIYIFNIDGKSYQNSLTNVPSFIPLISTVS